MAFRTNVTDELGLTGTAQGDAVKPFTIMIIQNHMEKAAVNISHTTKRGRKKALLAKPAELKQAETASRSAPKGPEKTELRKQEARLRRKGNAKLAMMETSVVSKSHSKM